MIIFLFTRARIWLLPLRRDELSASKKEKKAFASIRSKLSSEYKDRFQSAKNTHEKQPIMQKLYKLKIKGKCIYTSDTFKKWNEE